MKDEYLNRGIVGEEEINKVNNIHRASIRRRESNGKGCKPIKPQSTHGQSLHNHYYNKSE